MERLSVAERFDARVDRCAGPDGCHLWRGAVNSSGYGVIRAEGGLLLVHRLAWMLVHGEIPDGHVIDHVRAQGCRSLLCVNVAHLEPVTPDENRRRQTLSGDVNGAVGLAIIAEHRRSATHCRQGHPWTPENTAYQASWRRCRACAKESARRRRDAARTHQAA